MAAHGYAGMLSIFTRKDQQLPWIYRFMQKDKEQTRKGINNQLK